MTRVMGISRPGERGAASGFEAPFEMLHACHERVERMLSLLGKLRAHVREHGADAQAREAARDVMRYFDMAAPEHHRDEELHVFPPLLALGDEKLAQVVRRLQNDHLQMEARWKLAREVLGGLAEGTLPSPSASDIEKLDAFAALYADHLTAEESIVYPRAMEVLQGERLAEMTRDMMARRGLPASTEPERGTAPGRG